MDNLWATTPQFWTIVWGTIITAIFLIYVHVKIRKSSSDEAPSGLVMLLGDYVSGFDKLMNEATGGRLKHTMPYLFALFNYILIMSLISLFGFEPAPTSIIFTMTLAFISFIGIYVVGIGTKGLFKFGAEKYKNPLEIFSQFAPLISLSIRLFGATFAASIIGEILYIILGALLGTEGLLIYWWPALSGAWSWAWKFVDVFLSTIQAFIFVILTASYWSLEHGPSWKNAERKIYYQNEKDEKKKSKIERKSSP